MLISLTVGKVDAGVAVLLTEDKRHIEFPSILLPASITSGSIVDITVSQNYNAEQRAQRAFQALQENILNTYGMTAPTPPLLRLRNATQTSLVLEWDPIQLATSKLRSLSLYRNGSKAGNIPRPTEMLSTKISGLAVDTEYSFYMILRTSGGTYQSNTLTVKTQKMTDLTGITVTPGVLPTQLLESLEVAVERIGAKLIESVRIDTTHFVCTEGRGKEWEKAVEMSIPVVRPEWIEGCEREGKIIGVRDYYLDANPKHRKVGSNPIIQQQTQTPAQSIAGRRQSQSQNIPTRSNPRGSDLDTTAQGEPGPTVPPTPKEKEMEKDLPMSPEPAPAPPKDVRVVKEEEEDEESGDETPPYRSVDVKAKPLRAESEDDDGEEVSTSPIQPSNHKDKSGQQKHETSGDMEDVAL